MTTKFFGSFDELKAKLVQLEDSGTWAAVNDNQKQFRHNDGGVMNWFPSTGSINFQGRPDARETLQTRVVQVLYGKQFESPVPLPKLTGKIASEYRAVTEPISVPPEPRVQSQGVDSSKFLRNYSDSEIVIGLVGAVGTEMDQVIQIITDRLKHVGYDIHNIRVSDQVIPRIIKVDVSTATPAERIKKLMDAGDAARENTFKDVKDYGILASGVAAEISSIRKSSSPLKRTAFIINSLKHPDEVLRLRQIYPKGFYLIGVHPDETVRTAFLKQKGIDDPDIEVLIKRDQDEHLKHGQRVNDTFHLSDFFVRLDNNRLQLTESLLRIFDILFGDPYKTPTFDEYAMFLAFTASLRSADLSRQVGAVITKGDEILATGANDCPKYGGGLYWPVLNSATHKIEDKEDGRDHKRDGDSNKIEQNKIIEGILEKAKPLGIDLGQLKKALEQSQIRDLTEYGRVVHAEMEALLSCARNNVSTRSAKLFCTTFPCHNCAKHIIAAGITQVVFIEPYQKSKALEFHSDSISVGFNPSPDTVHFEPFVGVGPRRFFDLFSLRLGSGYPLERKDGDGLKIPWTSSKSSILRIQMLPGSYLELEKQAKDEFEIITKSMS